MGSAFRWSAIISMATLVLSLPGEGQAGTRVCILARVSGSGATLTLPDEIRQAAEGMPVPLTATIETGADSRVEIRCDDGVTVTVGAASKLDLGTLAGPSGDGESVLMRLWNGIVGIDAPNRTWDKFEVKTDVAIASVRSTQWLVEVKEDKATGIFVRRGKVAVESGNANAEVAEGQGVDVKPLGKKLRSIDASGANSESTLELMGELGPVTVWGQVRLQATAEKLGFAWNGN